MHELIAPHFSNLPTKLKTAINQAVYSRVLCPPKSQIFQAFYTHPLKETKVVIIGSEPMHIAGESSGLAFGRNKTNPTTTNIINEVKESTGSFCGDITLKNWATQGVLLLNTRLTTEHCKKNAHVNLGWEEVLVEFLKELDSHVLNKVYLLWGNEAQQFQDSLDNTDNLILATSHPSPASAHKGFIGCDHFAEANDYLDRRGRGGIIW